MGDSLTDGQGKSSEGSSKTAAPSVRGRTASKANGEAAKFGTFGGVFTPCTLTILGVIMFLRFGQVVGQSGLMHALLIILVAEAITVLTTLSLSAIATNTRVKGGGAYFLISRSLGVEYGGAIGLVFFLAQAISVAMYVLGFSEAFLAAFPGSGMSRIQPRFRRIGGVNPMPSTLATERGGILSGAARAAR